MHSSNPPRSAPRSNCLIDSYHGPPHPPFTRRPHPYRRIPPLRRTFAQLFRPECLDFRNLPPSIPSAFAHKAGYNRSGVISDAGLFATTQCAQCLVAAGFGPCRRAPCPIAGSPQPLRGRLTSPSIASLRVAGGVVRLPCRSHGSVRRAFRARPHTNGELP